MLTPWMLHAHHIRLIAIVAVFTALTGALSDKHAAYAQGSSNDYVDVAVILEAPEDVETEIFLDLDIVVVNNGSRTAYDVEVVVDVVYPEASSHFDLDRTGSVIRAPVGRLSLENNKHRLRWSIPALGGLQREELTVESRIRQTSNPTFNKRKFTHEFFGEVTTSSFDGNPGNNTSRVWSVPYLENGHRGAMGNYVVAATVDEPSPSPGDTVEFTITAGKSQRPSAGARPIDLKVAIELTGGLIVSGAPSYVSTSHRGTEFPKPSSVSYSSGVFTIGTLKFGEPAINAVTLPVRVSRSAVVNEQCLTAKLTGNPPPGTGPLDDDISDNVAKVCLGQQLAPYFTSGDLQEFVTHPCVSDSDHPCDNTDDVRVRAIYTGFRRSTGNPESREHR